MLRLNPQNDGLSKVTAAMIPGMGRIPGEQQQGKGLAVILPHFPAIVASGRIGTNNIYPDSDGIVRQYAIYRPHAGWRIPSLPARTAAVLGWPKSDEQDVLLNWRGQLGAFQTVRFSTVYEDFLSRKRQRPQNEFEGKVVIIGSSAPSLFDTKPTPMERIHPCVEVLATAVDNLKNGDWITSLSSPSIYIAVSLSLIWLTALAFLTGTKRSLIDGVFAGAQVGLVAVSYASLNLSTYFIDLTAPITAGFVYFTLARVYAYAEVVLAERRVWLTLETDTTGWQHTLVVALLGHDGALSESKVLTGLKRRLNARKEGFTIEAFPHKPAGIGRAYGDLLLVYYVDSDVTEKPVSKLRAADPLVAMIREEISHASSGCVSLGFSQGAMPYGNEQARVDVWRRLVHHAIHSIQDKKGKRVFDEMERVK